MYLNSFTLDDLISWLMNMPFRLLVNLIAVTIIVRGTYFRQYRRTDLFLTFFGFNIVIFLITFLLNQVQLSMGAAFGLFAIFSMLRYRTEGISAKDMTYLFMVIALGLLSAVVPDKGWLIWVNLVVVLTVFVFESSILIKPSHTKRLQYDKIDLIVPEKEQELLADLRQRTGLTITQVEVESYDFLKDTALLIIYYRPTLP
jgi:Domain of unknown function (DUF4956)